MRRVQPLRDRCRCHLAALLLAGVICLSQSGGAFAAEPGRGLVLAEDGKATVPVIISPKASDSTRAVDAELAQYLSRISGASFEVRAGDGSAGVVLGTLAEFPDAALEKSLERRGPGGFDGREAFTIRTEPTRLRVIGAPDLAASHAARCSSRGSWRKRTG